MLTEESIRLASSEEEWEGFARIYCEIGLAADPSASQKHVFPWVRYYQRVFAGFDWEEIQTSTFPGLADAIVEPYLRVSKSDLLDAIDPHIIDDTVLFDCLIEWIR